jgi:lysophospholipid acyltransferase (LPLAT)-like uncharacterized protein
VKSGWRYALAGAAGRMLATGLLSTVRFTVHHQDRFERFVARGEPVLFAVWHGRLLPLAYFHRGRGIAGLISQSRDGEYIARLIEGWGFTAIRGSTSRGGKEALREMVRQSEAGHTIAVTPDGPRGPRQKLQLGVLIAAQRTGLPILPVAAGCDRAWWPGGWDRFCVPKPFSRVTVLYGEPQWVPRDADEEDVRRQALEVERYMNALTEQVDRDGGPDR